MALTLDTFQVQPTTTLVDTSGNPLTLRLWYQYTTQFLDINGIPIMPGGSTPNDFYLTFACTIANNVITVASGTIYTTIDAQVSTPQSITCSARFYQGNTAKDYLFTQWVVPSEAAYPGGVITFEQLALYNEATVIVNPPNVYWTSSQIQDYFNTLSPAPNASVLIKGITKLSLAPVSATNPIAVGNNDPRLGSYINVITYGATGDDSTNNTTAFTNAQTAAAVTGAALYIPVGTFRLTGGFAFTSPVVFAPGASIVKHAGGSISFAKTITADAFQHFASTSTISVTFGASATMPILMEWFGALGDDSTDNSAAIAACVTAAGTRLIQLLNAIYRFSTGQTLPVNMAGYGPASALRYLGNGAAFTYANQGTNDNLSLSNLKIIANAVGCTHLLKLTSLTVGRLENLSLFCQGGSVSTAAVEFIGTGGTPTQDVDVENCFISSAVGDGIKSSGSAGINGTRVSGGRIQGCTGKGINIPGLQSNNGVKISGVTIEGNAGGQIYADVLRGSSITDNYFEPSAASIIPPIVGSALSGSAWIGVAVTGNSISTVNAPYGLDLNGDTASTGILFSGNDISGVGPFLLQTARFTFVENSFVGPNGMSGFVVPAVTLGANSRGIWIYRKNASGNYETSYESGSNFAAGFDDIRVSGAVTSKRLMSGNASNNDIEGQLTMSGGGTATYNYAFGPYAVAPHVVLTQQSVPTIIPWYTSTTSVLTVHADPGAVVTYHIIGRTP